MPRTKYENDGCKGWESKMTANLHKEVERGVSPPQNSSSPSLRRLLKNEAIFVWVYDNCSAANTFVIPAKAGIQYRMPMNFHCCFLDS
ncbi:MAG: hypothetical protein Q8O43_05925, partial [Dehalococcoidia bacterium]|nr:hypothetical protein [Dehalococcoidia bacterium]